MTHHTGSVPEHERAPDWRSTAACRAEPDAMHPDKSKAGIRYAKQICARCPVWIACTVDAIRTGDNQWGIRGGMGPEQRRKVADRLTDTQLDDPKVVESTVAQVLNPRTATLTLRDLWNQRAYVLPHGHMGWNGNPNSSISWHGRPYTPTQIAYIVDRGHNPDGILRRTCDVNGCVHPQHLVDNTERRMLKAAARQTEAAV